MTDERKNGNYEKPSLARIGDDALSNGDLENIAGGKETDPDPEPGPDDEQEVTCLTGSTPVINPVQPCRIGSVATAKCRSGGLATSKCRTGAYN